MKARRKPILTATIPSQLPAGIRPTMLPCRQGCVLPCRYAGRDAPYHAAMLPGCLAAMLAGMRPTMQPCRPGCVLPCCQASRDTACHAAMPAGMRPAMLPCRQGCILPCCHAGRDASYHAAMPAGMRPTMPAKMLATMLPYRQGCVPPCCHTDRDAPCHAAMPCRQGCVLLYQQATTRQMAAICFPASSPCFIGIPPSASPYLYLLPITSLETGKPNKFCLE